MLGLAMTPLLCIAAFIIANQAGVPVAHSTWEADVELHRCELQGYQK
jgi:hypothetical protein